MTKTQSVLDNWYQPLPIDVYENKIKQTIPEKIPVTNGCPDDYSLGDLTIACGPTVRFLATHENNSDNYRGTILLVCKASEEDLAEGENITHPHLTFKLGPSNEKIDGGVFYDVNSAKCEIIHKEQNYVFFRYSFEFELKEYEQKVKYAFNTLSLPYYQFFIPSKDMSMNILSYSCNGFSLGTETKTFKGSLWLDVIDKHNRSDFHYHVMLGGGDQIYADSITKTSKQFEHWLKHKHIHSTEKLTKEMETSFQNYYLERYMAWFGKGYWIGTNGQTIQPIFPIALATIPQINMYDDHDIIDGFGSYNDITMRQEIFQGVGRYAFKYYMLFQHHTPYKESPANEPSWIMGSEPGPYMNEPSRSIFARLGTQIGFLGLDCRTERTKHKIVYEKTSQIVFNRVEQEIHSSIENGKPLKHLLVLLGVPIAYPRMVFLEKLMDSPLVSPILWLARKGVIAHGLVNEFDGEVELLDDLSDHWCAHLHKKERNKLMQTLFDLGKKYNIRISVLSGDVHLCCASRFQSNDKSIAKNPEKDGNLVMNLVSSAIVNAPPPDGMVKFLTLRARKHYFNHRSEISEDMFPLFNYEPSSKNKREYECFLNKRNFLDIIPVSNISEEEKSRRYGEDRQTKYFVPGAVDNGNTLARYDNNPNEKMLSKANPPLAYPFDEEGLVARFNVEIDKSNTNSKTGAYEILVPSLQI